ncbi:RimJ/RimL family protein N-acetyltransferase [Phenylobacterium haematophilum]|uniref:RimJ/RimL family protein N-acetyltransferase n=1 Tax=Phenylobacterium haematophilum TaxID=98513 RepID=A0A839ZTU4_9CAUL|nr:GNAT family protein [Phenylobacterium haematophilum]MBB3889404.1 RimJ/RimL family protein N-acetyltransferase [Phenylobacterium haematophilum]
MDPTPPYAIRTARLLLREFTPDDLDDVHAYACDEATIRYMDWGPNTLAQTKVFLGEEIARAQAAPREHIGLAVQHLQTGIVIGSIRLGLQAHRNADIGYSYGSAWWRRGYGYEAAHALAAHAFEALDVHRLWATCDVRNAGSYALMEKLGMRREGTLRQNQPARDGGWRDTHVYGLLASEWASRRPA